MKEIWRDIEGYKGYYQISSLGRIKSLARTVNVHCRNYSYDLKEKILKQTLDSKGYLYVKLQIENKKKVHRVHRLISEAFIQNPNDKPYVNHIDGIKTNNDICNLEFVTPSENNIHAWSIGLGKNQFSV